MNWKVKTLLLFGKLRKPIEPGKDFDIRDMRKEADSAARLCTFLFDATIPINNITDEMADGVPVTIHHSMEGNIETADGRIGNVGKIKVGRDPKVRSH